MTYTCVRVSVLSLDESNGAILYLPSVPRAGEQVELRLSAMPHSAEVVTRLYRVAHVRWHARLAASQHHLGDGRVVTITLEPL